MVLPVDSKNVMRCSVVYKKPSVVGDQLIIRVENARLS